MALIVEDGTGIPFANSYNSVADADAYFADRNVVSWAGIAATTDDKEGFLIEAADYLNQFFRWRGDPYAVDQTMALPTLAFEGIPLRVKHAQLMLARERVVNGALSTPMGDRLVTSERKKLEGVVETEINYERSNVDRFGRVGSSVYAMLADYTYEPGGMQSARVDYV